MQRLVENDGWSAILAYGDRMVDQMPLPFLAFQYCANSGGASELAPCTPCSKQLLEVKDNNMVLSPVERRVTSNGIVELRAHEVSDSQAAGFVGVSCSQLGQVHVALVCDESKDQAEKMFEAAFASIAWKQNVPPAPELITENRRLAVREPLPFVRTQWGDGVIFPPRWRTQSVRCRNGSHVVCSAAYRFRQLQVPRGPFTAVV